MQGWQVRWLIGSSIVVAILLTVGSIVALSYGPYVIHGWLWDTLKEIGPAVAGVLGSLRWATNTDCIWYCGPRGASRKRRSGDATPDSRDRRMRM